MSFAIGGLYYLYWMYNTWVRIRDAGPGEPLSPFWRTFFSPLWIWRFLDHVKQEAISHGVPVQWSRVVLSSVYVLVTVLGSLAGNFPDRGMRSVYSPSQQRSA